MRDTLQGSYYRFHARLAPVAITGLVLLLAVCLGGVGGFFSYQLSSHVGESGPESHGLQGDQLFSLVRHPELLGRAENLSPQSDKPLKASGDEFVCSPITVGARLIVALIEPTIFINLPVIVTQVASPQQPRAPPKARSV